MSYTSQNWVVPEADLGALPDPDAAPMTEEEMQAFENLVARMDMEEERARLAAYIRDHLFPAEQTSDEQPRALILPPVPAEVRELDQHYLFGWHAPIPWFQALNMAVVDVFNPECKKLPTFEAGSYLLYTMSGYSNFYTGIAVHPDAPHLSPESGGAMPKSVPQFLVLSIANTSKKAWYSDRRPTPAQYRWLKGVMPGEPRWYRSAFSKKEWDASERDTGFDR